MLAILHASTETIDGFWRNMKFLYQRGIKLLDFVNDVSISIGTKFSKRRKNNDLQNLTSNRYHLSYQQKNQCPLHLVCDKKLEFLSKMFDGEAMAKENGQELGIHAEDSVSNFQTFYMINSTLPYRAYLF